MTKIILHWIVIVILAILVGVMYSKGENFIAFMLLLSLPISIGTAKINTNK